MRNFIDLSHILQDIPQQMNGSDCGMFACKFSEYLSRYENKKHKSSVSSWHLHLHHPHIPSNFFFLHKTIDTYCSGGSGFLSRRPTCLSSGSLLHCFKFRIVDFFLCCTGGEWSTRLWRTTWCTHRQSSRCGCSNFLKCDSRISTPSIICHIYLAWRKVMV